MSRAAPHDQPRQGIYVDIEGTDLDVTDLSIKRLNLPAAYSRYLAEQKVASDYVRCESIAVSRGGSSLYFAAKRGLDEEEIDEIVALSLREKQRRWTYALRGAQHDTIRDIAVAPDGASVYVLRIYNRKGKVRSLLTRLGRNRGEVLAEAEIPFRQFALDVSLDGQRVAVAGQKRMLHLLDSSLRPIKQRTLEADARSVRFLRSGEALVSIGTKILQLDPSADGPPAAFAKVSSSHLDVDDAEKTVLASPFPNAGVAMGKETPQILTILKLPGLEARSRIDLPGFDLESGAISPDGQRVACECRKAGDYGPGWVIIFETAAGREITRKRVERFGDVAFMRDSRTVVIGFKGMTSGEPLEFLKI